MIATPLVQLSITSADEFRSGLLLEPVVKAARKTRSSSFEKPASRKRSSHKRKQKVTFAGATGIETRHDAPKAHCEVTSEDLWFTQFDFHRFTKTVQQEAKTVRLAEEELLNGVDQSHSIAIRLAESVNKNAQDEKISMKVFNRLDMRNSGLADWCMGPDVRGLERLASKQLRHSKHFVRHELKKIVLGDDDCIASLKSEQPRRSNRKQNAAAETLAIKYQGITRESRLFARMMGLADELAAKHAYAEDEDC
jgi:hypothetical protein